MKIHSDRVIIESSNFSRFKDGVKTTCSLFTSLKIEGFINGMYQNELEFNSGMDGLANNSPISKSSSHECLTFNKRI